VLAQLRWLQNEPYSEPHVSLSFLGKSYSVPSSDSMATTSLYSVIARKFGVGDRVFCDSVCKVFLRSVVLNQWLQIELETCSIPNALDFECLLRSTDKFDNSNGLNPNLLSRFAPHHV
jgi:hypothetical protein